MTTHVVIDADTGETLTSPLSLTDANAIAFAFATTDRTVRTREVDPVTTTARHRAPMSATTAILEAQARAASPQPDAPLTAVILHLKAAHEKMTGRHAKPLDTRARVRNVTALREMQAVTR